MEVYSEYIELSFFQKLKRAHHLLHTIYFDLEMLKIQPLYIII